jgi:hypothetical protein
MRLVKLSDLSEEERRKALEEQQKRLEINNQERQRMQENANNEFNNIIAQNSTYNTRKADYAIGNIDLNNRPVYHNEDGSISTVRSMSFWDDNEKKEILIPTISFDKNGKAMSLTDDEAINRYYETGEYLGKFDDWKEADKYAEELHKNQEKLYNNTSKDINQQTSGSLWDKVINTSKIFQNLGLGISNGLMSFKQQIGRVTTNSIADREDLFNETKKDMIEKQLNKNSKSTTPNIVSQLVQKENKGDEIRRKAQETNEEIQKKKDINTNRINENIESMGNSVTKKLAEVSPSIGQMLPAFLPGGAVYMAGSATGQYYDDAKQRGMNEEEANTYSGIMGLMEGATEMIGIGNIQKAGKTLKTAIKGMGKEALKSATKGATKRGLKSALRSYGIGIADNVIQEALIDPIQEFTAEVVAGKDKAQWEDMGQRMLQDGINGGLVSAILGGANLGIQSCVGVVQKQHSNQKITEQEFKTAVKDASKQLDTTQMITSGVEQQLKKYTDYYTGKTLDDDIQDTFNRAQNIINNNQNSQQNMAKNQFETQEVIPNQNESALKSNMIKNENLPKTAIKDFNESAKKYNIDYNNEDLKEINQMFNKREITAYFDENTFKNNNEAFSVWKPTYDEQGNVSGREVVFNPKAQDTNTRVQELAIHELGHDLDLNEIQSMILKDASKKENWESARKSLENTYRQAYENDGVQISDENFSQIVDEEATMNILQRELGSQEYVNRLVNQNQSIAKKIYNWVIDKLNKFTGGKNEKIFWADIKNKFETAYNQEFNKNKNNLKYSVIYNKDGSFNRVKIDDNIFENNKGKSINNTIKEYLEKNINEYANIIESGQKVYLGKDLPGEYTYSKSTQNLSLPQKMAKGRAATELKEIISNVTNREYSNYKKEKHVKDAKYGFYKYDTKFSFEQNSKEQVYTGTVLIRNDANGKKYLYDILNIKKVGSNLPPVASNSQKSSAKIGGSKNIPTNSLPSTQQNVNSKIQKYSMQESENNSGSFNLQENKQKQLDIINKNNKMQDDYHTGIRKVEDIKTLAETLQDSDWIDYDEFNPDYTRNMANEALKTGKITVYSSYPIKQGTFVSPSRMEAEGYSGNGKIFSKEINIEDVAWIDPTQGQYANINQKYALPTKDWQQFVEENYQKQGTGKSLKEYNLPIKENVKQSENNKINPFRTSKEIANDKNISDLEALKEESQKINTLSLEDAKKLENELNKKNIEKSPTIDYIKEKRSRERVSIKEIKDTLAQKFVNKGHYIDKLANKTGNKNLTYLYDRTMNTFNEAQISIGDYQINSKGNVVGKSIIDIFKNSDDMNVSKEFDDYLLNKHNISRYAHEKGIFGKEISTIDSQGIINNYDKKYPQFKKWAKEVSKYNDNNLKDLVDNGLVSKETYKKLKEMYKDYVPTFRDISDNISQYVDDRVGGNTLKRATESNLNLLSVRESMAEQTLAIKKAIRINNLGIELYNVLGNKSTITTGIDFDVVALQTLAGNVIDSEGKGKNTFTIFQDGEMTQFKISDELYSAFSKDTLQNKINNNKVAKAWLTPIEKMSKAQRELLTTYSIGFAINNPIKDFQDALFNSKYNGATFMKNWTKALYNIATNGSWYKSYKNNGGTANTYFDYSKGILPTKTNNPIKKFGDKIKYLNEVLEQAPRLAEYISTIEHKGTIDEALYNAADITTNFKRGGDITKAINKYGANFLNASVQGLDKIWRNISGKNGWKGYANLAVKATAFQIAPAIINGILLGNDDDYDKLPDYTKDNYFLFKMEDGKFFRIPKGRLSSVIGGIARRSLEAGQSKDVKWNSLVETTINQLAPNNPMTDNVFAPIIQAKNNKTWFGGDIVNTRLKKLPTAEQYDESTDNLSKFLGKNLNISPKKINYVLDQYSGGVGDVVLPMMTPQAENNILEDKFTTDSVIKNKNVSQYYSEMEKLEKTKNSTKATDEDKIKYKYFTDSSSDISDLYGKKRDIQNSDMSDKDKKEQVRNIQKQINDIVENKLSNVNKLTKKDKYAQIDNCQYYKDIKGDWNQLSDEEKEKNKSSNISLKTYSDYKYQISKLKQEKVNKKELEKSEQLKDKDKIQVLINSNYSEVEKTNIYKNYIGNKDKKEIVVEKLGLPINEYLKYKSQTFVSDKDENGETIEGSKNEKIYNYLNNIKDKDLSQDYKKVICKMSGINTYDKDIVDNINNNKSLTTDERKEILTNIGFKIDKNNKIKINSKLPIIRYIK